MSKIVKNPKISKIFKKKLIFLQKIEIFKEEEKSSSFLNIRNTRFDLSSPVQPNPEKKSVFFFFCFYLKLKKNIFLCQSSPVQSVTESRGAPEFTEDKGQTEIFVSNTGFSSFKCSPFYVNFWLLPAVLLVPPTCLTVFFSCPAVVPLFYLECVLVVLSWSSCCLLDTPRCPPVGK